MREVEVGGSQSKAIPTKNMEPHPKKSLKQKELVRVVAYKVECLPNKVQTPILPLPH
jgi:hypothetical protein